MKGPKILIIDIETSPILAHVWSLWKQDIGLNQIEKEWCILSFAAKWYKDPVNKIIYKDQRNAKNVEDDKELVKHIWNLLNTADILLTHNGINFDLKKINARFAVHGLKPIPNIKHIDTYRLAKKHFAFTSNKLEYLTSKFCTKYKKSSHKKFPGFNLWKECLAGNKQAWKEMEVYNKYDILSLEELYEKLKPWDDTNFNLYNESNEIICNCGSKHFQQRGYAFTKIGKYKRYQCQDCGKWTRGRYNQFSSEKRDSLRV